jgi:hypothetical protein
MNMLRILLLILLFIFNNILHLFYVAKILNIYYVKLKNQYRFYCKHKFQNERFVVQQVR